MLLSYVSSSIIIFKFNLSSSYMSLRNPHKWFYLLPLLSCKILLKTIFSTNIARMKHHLFCKNTVKLLCLFLSGKIPSQKYPDTSNFDLLFLKVVIIFTWRYLSLLSFLSEPCWRCYYGLEISPIRQSTKTTSVTSMKKFSTTHMTEHMRLQLTPSSPHLTKYHAPPPTLSPQRIQPLVKMVPQDTLGGRL